MSDESNGALAALGALLGYVGAEAATTAPFEHLLWPHRYLSNFSLSTIPTLALLMPIGGPFHKVALEAYDTLSAHGLFLGRARGHMLGTAFFTELGWTYTLHVPGQEPQIKPVRNCLWAVALGLLRFPELGIGGRPESPARKAEKGVRRASVRARISVHHLTFSRATAQDRHSGIPFVKEGTGTPGPSIFLALIAAESTAIVLAIILATVWRTPWAALWVAPLVIRLLSAAFALKREPLIPAGDSSAAAAAGDKEDLQDFEINCPQSNGDFMVLTGPPTIVLQFMRHYGHPVRNRNREILQIAAVMALGCVFPLGLVASALFMPLRLQYVWFGYQLYLVVALHFARYSRHVATLSTHAAIAEAFGHERSGAMGGRSILFGQTREAAGTIKVDLVATYHDRHQDGKLAVERLLNRRGMRDGSSEESEKANASASGKTKELDLAKATQRDTMRADEPL